MVLIEGIVGDAWAPSIGLLIISIVSSLSFESSSFRSRPVSKLFSFFFCFFLDYLFFCGALWIVGSVVLSTCHTFENVVGAFSFVVSLLSTLATNDNILVGTLPLLMGIVVADCACFDSYEGFSLDTAWWDVLMGYENSLPNWNFDYILGFKFDFAGVGGCVEKIDFINFVSGPVVTILNELDEFIGFNIFSVGVYISADYGSLSADFRRIVNIESNTDE